MELEKLVVVDILAELEVNGILVISVNISFILCKNPTLYLNRLCDFLYMNSVVDYKSFRF